MKFKILIVMIIAEYFLFYHVGETQNLIALFYSNSILSPLFISPQGEKSMEFNLAFAKSEVKLNCRTFLYI